MAETSVIFRTTCSFTILVILSNYVGSEFLSALKNATDYTSPLKGRSKRSLHDVSPIELRMKIKYRDDESIGMVFTKASEKLANEYLPIHIPHVGFYTNVMKDIGDFVLYQDYSKCSAIVYFGNFNTLYGMIGMDYYLQDLPFSFDARGIYTLGIVSEPFIKKRENLPNHIHPGMVYPPPSDTEAWSNFLSPVPHNSDQSHEEPPVCELPSSGRGQQSKENVRMQNDGNVINTGKHLANKSWKPAQRRRYKYYFLEILVFVTRDMVELFKSFFGGEQHIEWIVRYLIIYFNTVDMMFGKMKATYARVHMNLAKVVIENEHAPYDFIKDGDLQFSGIVETLPQYLNVHAKIYPRDSFDHVFIYTSRPIFDDIVEVNGMTKYGKDLYEARKNDQFYEAVSITAVRFQYYYADYPVAVHEIGRIFGLKLESQMEGLGPAGQCAGVMQRGGPKCRKCLKWSAGSRIQFGKYLRKNKNRCFFLNNPRSILPRGIHKFVRPLPQCECFGYISFRRYDSGLALPEVGFDGCDRPMECVKSYGSRPKFELTVLPFDGTQCTSSKVCWEKQCVHLTPSAIQQIQH